MSTADLAVVAVGDGVVAAAAVAALLPAAPIL